MIVNYFITKYKTITMMPRKSKSPSKSKRALEEGSIKFCHYKNGMFMGQMKCFERSGKGIVFLDTG